MANATNNTGVVPHGQFGRGEASDYEPPPSLLLQIFLFCAFLVTVAAYVAGQRAELSAEQSAVRARNVMLNRQTVAQGKYRAYVKLGLDAKKQKDFAGAVSNFQNAVLQQNTGVAHYYLGEALRLDSRTNEALKEFQTALALDPKLKALPPVGVRP
ncbi:MAG TPA: tetratricopeptide repeat protein [Candidatus Acidoferrum sp.]|nr:tetratricopeptide repeat protein [Candidatus Acidoferrum sp.]